MESYKEEQKIPYTIIKNSILKNKISHAYIVETNKYINACDFVKKMVIEILKENSILSNIEDLVDSNNYPDFKILSTRNLQYKKEDIKQLLEEFKTKPVAGKYKIYLIKDADKLNNLTANSLLKFIEEPEEGIIAILMVENKFQLLKTIISRCQVLTLNENKTKEKSIYNFYMSNGFEIETIDDEIKNVFSFIVSIEKNKKNAILYENKFILNNYQTKEDIRKVLEIMKLIYIDSLKIKNNSSIEYFESNKELIKKISEINSNEQIIKKINYLIENIKRLYYNVNINLLLDKVIIDLGGC